MSDDAPETPRSPGLWDGPQPKPAPKPVEPPAPPPPLLPWERQDDEPDDSWLAFVAYRDMRPRNLKNIVGNFGYKGRADAGIHTLMSWSKKHGWRARALAYDRHVDDEVRAHAELMLKYTVEEMQAQHREALKTGWEYFHGELNKLLNESQGGGSSKAKLSDLVSLMKQLHTMGLRENEMAETLTGTAKERPYKNLPIEKVEQLQRLMREAEEAEENGGYAEELPEGKRHRVV